MSVGGLPTGLLRGQAGRADPARARSTPVKLEMRAYFLAYLDECARALRACAVGGAVGRQAWVPRRRGPGLEAYVTSQLVQLLCRTTKLCWFDEDRFRGIVQDAQQLLDKGSQARAAASRARRARPAAAAHAVLSGV